MKVWVIADTHFNHAKMCEAEGRPENFNEVITANWRRLVGVQDMVIHLGDVMVGRDSEMQGIIENLPGRKVLTLGNHDQKKPRWYMERGFVFACHMFVFNDIAFSHEPVLPLPSGATLNIHGHLHSNQHRLDEYRQNPLYRDHAELYKLCSIEGNLSPILLEDLMR